MSGTLIIAGGALRASENDIFSAFVAAAGGPTAKFAFIVAASGAGPDETFHAYALELGKHGVPPENCILIPLYAKHVVDERGVNLLTGDSVAVPPYLDGVTGVWFTGGDQYFIAQCLVRADATPTNALQILHSVYENGGVIGGSSAGAAMMSHVMIGDGNNRGMLYHDTVFGYDTYDEICEADDPVVPLIITRGLGFFRGGVVDQHFNKRPRMLRTIEACLTNEDGLRMGFGVSEDTALVYHNGEIQVLGSGGVYIMDCRNATKGGAHCEAGMGGERCGNEARRSRELESGKGCYEGVVLHAIHKGDKYSEATGEVTLAKDGGIEKSRWMAPDFVNAAIIDSPVFDDFIATHVLQTKDDCLYLCPKTNKRYAKGVVIYEAHEKTFAVVLKYFRDERTRGYRIGHTSFANVGLTVSTTEIVLK